MNNLDYEKKLAFMSKLKALIHNYLDLCDSSTTPYLCEYVQQKENYDEVVEFCVTNFIVNQKSIGDSLSTKENILNPNYLND